LYFTIIGVKATIVLRIKENHLQFVLVISRPLSPPDKEFVDGFFRKDISIPEVRRTIVATIIIPYQNSQRKTSVTIENFHCLNIAKPLSIMEEAESPHSPVVCPS
jgi:hypothetical protein